MSNFNQKSANNLTAICQDFIIKYTHQLIWRQVDPPNKNCHECFKPTDFPLLCPLPTPAKNPQKNPELFRKRFYEMRYYFASNLVRPVYEALALACHKFVSQNRLKYGDVILSLVFQDSFSHTLEIKAKHLVFRKWSLREERSLQRVLMFSTNLVKLTLPGKADEKLLILISKTCHHLEDLDISTSYVTDRGLLAICGVEVEQDDDGRPTDNMKEKLKTIDGIIEKPGPRAAASRAREKLDQIKTDPSFLRKLAIGSSSNEVDLKDTFSLLTTKMRPYVDKKQDPSLKTKWSPKPGYWNSFSNKGCKKLVKLDLTRTNYPKRSLSTKGDMIVTLGLTRDSVLAALILLENLKILKWNDLGEILQLYEMVFQETWKFTPKLKLGFLMDSCLTIDKLEVANRICPEMKKMDVSMFNFSFAEMDFHAGPSYGRMANPEEESLSKSNNLIFNFTHLKDLEVQYMDDSPAFQVSIKNCASNLTRLCLNKMISISFETLAAIKNFCKNLETFEVFVDNIQTVNSGSTLEQVIAESSESDWISLKSLKLGGLIPSGNIILYLVTGCTQLRALCLSPYESQAEIITDKLVEDMLRVNPCTSLVAFYFEKCFLSENTFFLLLSSLPKLKYMGILSEWFGMDRRARLAVKAFVKGNNVDVDIDSAYVHDC